VQVASRIQGPGIRTKDILTKELGNACIEYTGSTYGTIILIAFRRQLTTRVSIYGKGMGFFSSPKRPDRPWDQKSPPPPPIVNNGGFLSGAK